MKKAAILIIITLAISLTAGAQDEKTSEKGKKNKSEKENVQDTVKTKKVKQAKEQKTVKMNTYTDIYQMIRREVPGVVVSGHSIMVQGPNSFYGSSQPLFVVNGNRVSSIDNINPLDVKSIRLLKGSYANIYGNDGANGVISITLLNGSEKK
jgi:outer membrane receptor for ferrienterochelin and colicin